MKVPILGDGDAQDVADVLEAVHQVLQLGQIRNLHQSLQARDGALSPWDESATRTVKASNNGGLETVPGEAPGPCREQIGAP